MYIRYTTESSRRWSVTPDEEAFLAALEAALRQGRKTWMQYMVRNDAESVEDVPLEEYIHHLSFWVRSA